MDNKQIRFDLELNENDFKTLNDMMKCSHRSRKNLCEALVKISIKAFKEGKAVVDLDDLGVVEKQTS